MVRASQPQGLPAKEGRLLGEVKVPHFDPVEWQPNLLAKFSLPAVVSLSCPLWLEPGMHQEGRQQVSVTERSGKQGVLSTPSRPILR